MDLLRPRVPRHVGIIMDGNGRWAKERGLPRLAGHRAGVENIRPVLRAAVELGIPYLTLYAFSTENWARPADEVNGLLGLLAEYLDREVQSLHAEGVRLLHLGRLDRLSPDLQRRVRAAIDLTRDNTRLTLAVAFNYGGRADIVEAARAIVAAGIPLEQIDEACIAAHLATRGLPDPDLIIRTSGEWRLSNFLIWQAAYSEYWTTPVYWPDFRPEHLSQAVEEYGRRERRYGGVRPPERAPVGAGSAGA